VLYQWISLILIGQGLLFRVSRRFWKYFENNGDSIYRVAYKVIGLGPKKRLKKIFFRYFLDFFRKHGAVSIFYETYKLTLNYSKI
jgi:hypothetical protein